ncbi:DNA repair protein RecN [Pseudomonas kermanshahensis]|jgi:DNA repair protein RecN (Recombination protein N)|uniref:DNA repair protein RecN n=1 Tax=Pseudomonas TaxID=286 RepID=UPI000420F587|nr:MULTISPECIES: DNA repair protein RecN [Pseudomonas]GLO58710.1 DNA repair protein RecN [Pseudomonas putida]MDE4536054.1 DNA repair protein RecN [Pseudomonas sp. ITEM 17296]WEL54921.1 DNA repair protein RecN [Pseudomonas kermanshahensis]SMF62337.1 DNA replication and repair protein RecN [Pseudomonas sp. LAIL14HWK12:I11]SMR80226.1 DNA replication and repair protein RecN [Pseudomonas sp. LAIL14HWK12:I10]
MLVHLSIHNYAIVEHLDLELARGMSVITGETGAGKSIMLDALGLALGDRADSGVVRPGADKADILATFDLADIPEASTWLAERDLDNDGPCILRRVITAEGRSRGYINGTPCPLSDLKSLGELLIDIHSQHEHQSLLKTDTHRRLLDEYAGAIDLARQVQLAAKRWNQTRLELERLSNSGDEQRARHQLLSYQLEELDNLGLGENELVQLEQEHKNLTNAEALFGICRQVIDQCSESDSGNVLSALTSSLNRLGAATNSPKALGEAANLIASAQIQVEEAVGELNRFLDHFDADPMRLQALEERLDTIYTLARKHRVHPTELPHLQQRLMEELEGLNASDESIERLGEELAAYAQHYKERARELSALRQQAAQQLAVAVEQEVQRLGMPGGRFCIELTPNEGNDLSPHGLEQIELLVSANPGQPLKGLAKVASGGELSRISLAIQVITAQTSRIPTLVFDEVDVGIGGPTAEIVGQLLRRLGDRGQVLTVTHLPQVAAQGHHHLFVHKVRHSDTTHTAVASLGKRERVEEVARMLGGIDLTKESLAHARKMVVSGKA